MNNARVNQISSGQLASLLTVLRLSTLMLSKSVAFTQLLAELVLTTALSLIAFSAYKNGLYPKENASRLPFVAVLAILVSLDTAQYFSFTSGAGSSDVPLWLTAALLSVFVLYSGTLGFEAVARFSVLAVLVALLFIVMVTVTNIYDAQLDFLKSAQNEKVNALSLLKSLDVPLLFLLLAPNTAKKQGRAIVVGTAVPYLADGVIVVMCRAVLGRTAGIYKSPVFALFQLAEAGDFNKLDIMYVSLILLLLFCELSLVVSLIVKHIKKQVKE